MKKRRIIGIRLIVSLAAASLLVATGLAIAWVAERNSRRILTEEIQTRLLVEARNLAFLSADALLGDFPELTLVPLVTNISKGRDELSLAVVVDHQGVVQGHLDPRQVSNGFNMPPGLSTRPTADYQQPGELVWESEAMWMAEVPIRHRSERTIGRAYLGLRRSYHRGLLLETRHALIRLTAIMLPVSVALVALFMSYLLRPVGALKRGLERIGRGQLDSPMHVRDRTELGLLADSVNEMTVQLKTSRELAQAREREIVATQKEIVHTLGEVVENRSTETANHTRRVSEMCYLLATRAELAEDEARLLRMASPLHDVGKISIPDYILNKPGSLTKDEYAIMKTHASVGYRILSKSERPILKAAATIAYEHHERWDGGGYPRGIAGKNIHIFSRIVSLVDVFDAVYTDRVYRPAMSLEETLDIINEGSGTEFDPRLVKVFLKHLDEFLAIHDKLAEEPWRATVSPIPDAAALAMPPAAVTTEDPETAEPVPPDLIEV